MTFDFGPLFPSQTVELVLRDYQQEAVSQLRSSFGSGKTRPLLQAPTGAGKTVISAYIAQGAVARGNRVLFVAPFLELLRQTQATFERFGIHSTIWHGQHDLDTSAPVAITTAQTLARRLADIDAGRSRYIPEYDLGVYDEAHVVHDRVRLLMLGDGAKWIGLSATPWSEGLGLLFDDLVRPVSLAELVDRGILSSFTVMAPSDPDLSGARKSKSVSGYVDADLEEIMGGADIVGDVVDTWLKLGVGKPTLAFGVNRAHASFLAQAFLDAGVRAGYVDAHVKGSERRDIIQAFKDREIDVLCNVRALTTGFDAPVGCIVDAAPTRSEKLHVQKIGRGLRVNPGTEDCLILDHAGNTLRLGMVTDIDRAELSVGQARKGEGRDRSEPLPQKCGSCNFVKPPKVSVCPACGFKPQRQSTVEAAPGELVELQPRKGVVTAEEKQRWFSQLTAIARERGRSDGWVSHTYRDKFGVWPRGLSRVPQPPTPEVRGFVKHKDIAFAKARQTGGAA